MSFLVELFGRGVETLLRAWRVALRVVIAVMSS
jgi:hypothetical protein